MHISYFLCCLALILSAQPPQATLQTSSGEPIYKIAAGNGVKPAKPLYTPEPEYSEKARKKRIQGVVTLEGYVAPDGRYHDAKVVVSLEKGLDENALAAVKTWRFSPCTKDDKPVNCSMKVEISYHLFHR